MPKWFRAKKAGFGFAPSNAAGWSVTVAFVAVVIMLSRVLPRHSLFSKVAIFGMVAAYVVVALTTLDRGN